MSIKENIKSIKSELPESVTLVAVSKTKPNEDIMKAYDTGHRDFGENKIQDMVDKYESLPKDINWHMIGHVQSNKVKYMAPFVKLIHGVDSLKLLKEINKQAKNNDRTIDCLLQIKIAEEDSKFGISAKEAEEIINSDKFKELKNINVVGLMGMATYTTDEHKIDEEFKRLQKIFHQFEDKKAPNINLTTISSGMSGDYKIALKNGTTMIRVGSSIFGNRNY
ncbi:hypothetical protein SAMN03097699_1308 [Flavobacteriaceae bacterium MAR_2010_188]|nr:hypothetical protein SAMN03097699_1308 [Flavobacteriaceae bacterium MAR_2010_188]